jgi:2,4-dienoyl-CoA reductase-like NADH-dependent reductase (Old Yellow Enzyme family)/pyruvate/2-oxoglutarate dehydrogenase complex dihydrolipoamide dehydrogenase (E3) component
MKLFEPIKVGSRIFKNRIMFAPINFCYEDDDECLSPETIRYMSDIAKGGAAYLVLGEVYPVDVKKRSPKITSDDHIHIFKKLCDSIHEHDVLIGAQIYYPDENNIETISIETLMQIREDYLLAIDRLVQSGFDVIQLSGEKFLGSVSSAHFNKRKDDYGGTLQNRLRFAIELIREIKMRYPKIMLEYKLAVTDDASWKGLTLDEAKIAAKLFEEAGLDLIHAAFTNPSHGETVPAMGIKPYGCFTHIASAIKKEVSIPVSTAGRIIEAQMAEAILETEQSDIIALGRALIADPAWPQKVLQNKPIRYCVSCNKCLDKIADEKKLSCSLHAGRSKKSGADETVKQNNNPQNILVAGGGVAGLEAARIAALQGNRVTLYEKTFSLGGQVLLAAAPPRKQELLRFINYLTQELIRLKVDIQFGKHIDEDFIIAQKPDRVIIAVGAQSPTLSCNNIQSRTLSTKQQQQKELLSVKGINLPHVFDSWEILSGKKQAFGNIAIIGGGFVGIEVAEYLCVQENQVSIIEVEDEIGIGQSASIWPTMMANYKKHDVQFFTNHRLKQITKNEIICRTQNGDVIIPCNCVVIALNGKSISFPTDTIRQAGIQIDVIGDCKQIGDIEAAINAAAKIFSA